LRIEFPYGSHLDDIFDELIQKQLSDTYLGFEYNWSETDGNIKESEYIMKLYRSNDDYVCDTLDEIFDCEEAHINGVRYSYSLLSEKVAKQEGFDKFFS